MATVLSVRDRLERQVSRRLSKAVQNPEGVVLAATLALHRDVGQVLAFSPF